MQEYQYDNNNQSSNNFSFQANNVNTTGTPSANYTNSSQPVYTQNIQNNNKAEGAGDLFKLILGSGLVSLSVIIAICMVFVAIATFAKDDDHAVVDTNDSQYEDMINAMEANHQVYDELDEYFANGEYEKMYERYLEELGNTDFGSYHRMSFLSCLDSYHYANDYYDDYVNRENDSYHHFSSFLYYSFDFITEPNYYTYSDLAEEEKVVIDEMIKEVKNKTALELNMSEDALDEFIESFKTDGSKYIDYSAITEYAREVYGD